MPEVKDSKHLDNEPEFKYADPGQNGGESIVLLDVDQTLLYNGDGDINQALIDVLKQQGIKKVYFLTKMDLKDIRSYGREGAPRSRAALIDHLKAQGITVAGVITPADPYFSACLEEKTSTLPDVKSIGPAYASLYEPLMKKRMAQGAEPLDFQNYALEDTLEYLYADLHWTRASNLLRHSQELQKNEKKKIPKLGLFLVDKKTGQLNDLLPTLDAAKDFFIHCADAEQHRGQYVLMLNEIPGETQVISQATYGTTNTKAAMLKHALNQGLFHPGDRVCFFDDEETCLQGVTSVVHEHNDFTHQGIHISTCLMPTDFVVANSEAQKEKYKSCLQGKSSTFLANQPMKAVSDLSQVFPFEIDEESWSSVLSDHCGQCYSIPINSYYTLGLTSFNMMMTGPRAFSAPNNRVFYEDDSLSYERLSRITEVLKRDVALHKTAVFVFQEVQPDFILEKSPGDAASRVRIDTLSALKERMGPDWRGIKGAGGLVTFYNSKELILEAEPLTSDPANPDRSLQTLFREVSSNRLVNVVNIHKLHQDNTKESIARTEAYISGFATPYEHHGPVTVVAGDFNLRLPSPQVYPRDNRTGIIPANFRHDSGSDYDGTDACFVQDVWLSKDFHQIKTDELFSGVLDPKGRAHFKRLPLDPRQLLEKKQELSSRLPVPVIFQKDHQLFSMGPRLEDLQNHFISKNYSLRVDPSFHRSTLLIETCSEKVIILDCNRVDTKIQLMDVPFANPNPLSQFFETIKKEVPQGKRKPIQVAAFDLLAAFDDYQCFIAQSKPDEVYKQQLENRYRQAEQRLQASVFDVNAGFGSRLNHALDLLCTWFTCSLFVAIVGSVVGAALGAAIGAGVGAAGGTFTIPFIGSFAGALAGALSGAILGAGVGFLAGGCTLGIKMGKQVSHQSKHTFFCDHSKQGFGKNVQDFINTCELTPSKRS